MLTTLAALHAQGYVHRDVRRENILVKRTGWLLIDWELAAPCGQKVFWNGAASPPSAQKGSTWLPEHDLWQLGHLIKTHRTLMTPALEALADMLMSRGTVSALQAQHQLRSIQQSSDVQ